VYDGVSEMTRRWPQNWPGTEAHGTGEKIKDIEKVNQTSRQVLTMKQHVLALRLIADKLR